MDYLAAIGRSGALPSAVQGVTGMMKDMSTLENLQTERAVSQERVRGMQQESRIREFTIKENEKKEEFLNRGWNPEFEPTFRMLNDEQKENWRQWLKVNRHVDPNTGVGTQRDFQNVKKVMETDKEILGSLFGQIAGNLQIEAINLRQELEKEKAKGADPKKIQQLTSTIKAKENQWGILTGKIDWAKSQIDINKILQPFIEQPAPQGSNAPSMLDYLVAKYPNFQIALSIAQQTGDVGKLQETINKVVEIENREPKKPTSKIIKEQEVDPKTGNTYEQTYNVDEQGNKMPMGGARMVKEARKETTSAQEKAWDNTMKVHATNLIKKYGLVGTDLPTIDTNNPASVINVLTAALGKGKLSKAQGEQFVKDYDELNQIWGLGYEDIKEGKQRLSRWLTKKPAPEYGKELIPSHKPGLPIAIPDRASSKTQVSEDWVYSPETRQFRKVQ